MMHVFRVAYDGHPYHGFQRQPTVTTVEDTLFAALAALDITDDVPPEYSAAGRTDAGVSALAQTIAFDAPDWLTPAAFNTELPPAIRVWAHATPQQTFHAQYHATEREYTYHLYAPDARPDRAHEAAARLSGTHDYHNLTPDDTNTTRTLTITAKPTEPFLRLRVTSTGFPRQLVRRLTTLIHDVATDRTPLSQIDRVLDDTPVSGPNGIQPAPAHPLVLTRVEYDTRFTPDPTAVADTRNRFTDRYTTLLGRAHATRTISGGLPDEPD